jgi:DNA-binding GntR family transcriptional regulator
MARYCAATLPRMARNREPAPWVNYLSSQLEGTVQEVALSQLRALILAGVAPPGAPINVDDVAERFQVSRIPVREALKTLIAEGLVEHEPRGGFTVCQVTRNELSELYTAREALERAALRAAVPRATPADDLAVRRAFDELTSSVNAHDGRAHQRGSKEFHFAMVRPCGMARLLTMLEQAWNLTMPMQPMRYLSTHGQHALHDDHQAMVDAFLAREIEVLLALSSLHYKRNQSIVSGLPEDARLRPE